MKLDARDLAFLVGTLLVGAGFWLLLPALALLWFGAVLMAGAIMGAKRWGS